MSNVSMKLTVHARGEMATKLLEAAEELGLEPWVIRSQSDGFLVPVEVHRHLFPSQYDEDGQPVVESDAPEQAPADDTPVTEDNPQRSDPADDFSDLTEAELDKLTKPEGQ